MRGVPKLNIESGGYMMPLSLDQTLTDDSAANILFLEYKPSRTFSRDIRIGGRQLSRQQGLYICTALVNLEY
jgi:hypothetical protein